MGPLEVLVAAAMVAGVEVPCHLFSGLDEEVPWVVLWPLLTQEVAVRSRAIVYLAKRCSCQHQLHQRAGTALGLARRAARVCLPSMAVFVKVVLLQESSARCCPSFMLSSGHLSSSGESGTTCRHHGPNPKVIFYHHGSLQRGRHVNMRRSK